MRMQPHQVDEWVDRQMTVSDAHITVRHYPDGYLVRWTPFSQAIKPRTMESLTREQAAQIITDLSS